MNLGPDRTLKGHRKMLTSLAFSGDGKLLLSGSFDGTARVWDVGSGQQRQLFTVPAGWLNVAISPDASIVAAQSHGLVHLWARDSGSPIGELPCPSGFAFLDNDRIVTGAIGSGGIVVWDARTLRERSRLVRYTEPIMCLSASPDGRALATANHDGSVTFWDLEHQRERATLFDPNHRAFAVVTSPDGGSIATAGADRNVKIWRARRSPAETTAESDSGSRRR
jgi:WD40 repeat protein